MRQEVACRVQESPVIDMTTEVGNTVSMNTTEITPAQIITFFRGLNETHEITAHESRMAMKRWAQTGRASIIRKGVRYTWTVEAFDCDCGKGIHCPLIKQRSA